MSNVFNHNAQGHHTGVYPLFLGEQLGIHDSINRCYPKLFEFYKQQKAQDWSEDEVPLDKSRQDFITAPRSETEVCLETLMWQWEADTRVSQNMVALLSPFITNPEYFTTVQKIGEIESLHALTYSEIIKNCIEDSISVIDKIKANQALIKRSSVLERVMLKVERMGALLRLNMLYDEYTEEEVRQELLKFMVALTALEGIEFIGSFACTFALAERDLFFAIAQLVQKIMLDEILHTKVDIEVIKILKSSPVWQQSFENCKHELKEILDEVVRNEQAWASYIFSDGRAIVGLNTMLLNEWVYYNAKPLYDILGIDYTFPVVTNNPIPYMDKWMEIDKQQNANQEQDNTQYLLNTLVDDIGEDVIYD